MRHVSLFCESEKKKKWENADVKFINDVKRIIQTILTKRITKIRLQVPMHL